MDQAQYERSLAGKSVGRRAAIVAAGPIANIILAIAIFAIMFAVYGRAMTSPKIDEVVAGSAAAEVMQLKKAIRFV